jgi:Kef-type K+ transport system membrane component KefB
MHGLLQDIAVCTIAAWALGVVAHVARQPVILAYLIGGFAVGPSGLRLVQSQESVEAISELGLIFLLFMIGLEIDLKKVLSSGRTILATAAFQIVGGSIARGAGLRGDRRPPRRRKLGRALSRPGGRTLLDR